MKPILTFIIIIANILSFSQTEKSPTIILAEEYFYNADYSNSLKYYLEAWEIGDILSCNVSHKIAICYYNHKDYKKAIEWYQRAIDYEVEPWNLAAIYSSLGWSYEETGNHKEALKCFDQSNKFGLPIPSEFLFEKEGWYFVTQTQRDYIYYKKNSIKNLNGNKKQVWTKWYWDENSLSDEDIKRMAEIGGKDAFQKLTEEILEDRKGVKSSLIFFEFDCKNDKTRILSGVDYAVDRSVLHSDDIEGDWSYIVPGSVSEIIASVICK